MLFTLASKATPTSIKRLVPVPVTKLPMVRLLTPEPEPEAVRSTEILLLPPPVPNVPVREVVASAVATGSILSNAWEGSEKYNRFVTVDEFIPIMKKFVYLIYHLLVL